RELSHSSYEKGAFMAMGNQQTLGKMATPVLTSTVRTNGAIVAWYPGVKEKLAEMFGESFYLVFTSIHEARIHAKSVTNPREILRMLKRVNAAFEKDEILSRKVWLYEKETGKFQDLEL
ncbi:MAG: DUF5688 family protein, partial [bacterium]|nr:DUF5688 family protein [bacterium]